MNSVYEVKPIGLVHSSLHDRAEAVDSDRDRNTGEIEIFREYENGLCDIDGFSHIIVIFWFHQGHFKSLKVTPLHFPDKLRGVFATRHPDRPNPVGVTVVRLLGRKGNILQVGGIDMLDGTPIIDIKPYTRGDQKKDIKLGWLSGKWI
jgi:tRNA-Thr(GGU) m(6)t(6)A37 methyltransferase TsaA